jgi:hypothetical protein
MLDLAEQAQDGLRGAAQQRWIARLQIEVDNMCAAARWYSADPVRAPLGLRLAAALWEFWQCARLCERRRALVGGGSRARLRSVIGAPKRSMAWG